MKRSHGKQGATEKVKEIPALEKALLCAQVAASHKAEDPTIYQVDEIVTYTDYFVICAGRSTRHVQGIAGFIEEALVQRRGKPMGVEGFSEGPWGLLDFNDVIVHIFYKPMRAFYDLEGLWFEARQIEFQETGGPE